MKANQKARKLNPHVNTKRTPKECTSSEHNYRSTGHPGRQDGIHPENSQQQKEPPRVQGKTQEKPPILIFPNTNAVPNEEGKHNVCEAPLKMGLQT